MVENIWSTKFCSAKFLILNTGFSQVLHYYTYPKIKFVHESLTYMVSIHIFQIFTLT